MDIKDIRVDFKKWIAKKEDGFFCSFCERPDLFKSSSELWEDHIYEPVYEFIKDKINSNLYICFYNYDFGTEVKILTETQVNEDKYPEYLNLIKPILPKY